MLCLRPPSDDVLQRVLEDQQARPFPYPAIGATAGQSMAAGGRIRFQVIAFSRPYDPVARLGGPLARALQVRTIGTYLRAMEAATT